MKRSHLFELCVLAVSVAVFVGCASGTASIPKTIGNETDDIDCITQALDSPPTEVYPAAHSMAPITARTVQDLDSYSYRNLSLSEVMQSALEHSEVLRELGGTVLRNPDALRTQYAQRLQNSDPRFGREAVLSEFDAQLRASAVFNNNDRIFNNSFFAGGATGFKQDLHDYQVELSKRTATGSELSLRSVFSHDANNAPANTFRSAWNAYYEGEFRQPLLQGGGLEFNRIAGPNSTPGVYNGVLIARANADINETDFEVAVRDFVSNVENAYWDLYFAYRDVDARRKAMTKALEVWNRRKALKADTDPAELALAQEQYYRFKADLDEAVAGRLVQGTQSRNGSTGGTLRGTGGLLVAERKLRLLIGLPTGDGSLIRPAEEPTMAEVIFDWDSIRSESLNQRAELRQQQARVRRREMELLASKNFLNPRLDVFGRYRFRGFGDDLINDGNNGGSAPASAIGNMFTGNLQGWTAGVEVSVPVGYRRAHAAVANAELQVARERAIHQEQQREVVHDLGNALADVARARQASGNNLNRYLAAEQALKALQTKDQQNVGRVDVDRILDAQRRAVEAEIRYFRSRAEYAVALKNVHFEKGSLLEFNNVRMAGMDSPAPTVPQPSSQPPVTPPMPDPAPPIEEQAPSAAALTPADFAPLRTVAKPQPRKTTVATEVKVSTPAIAKPAPPAPRPKANATTAEGQASLRTGEPKSSATSPMSRLESAVFPTTVKPAASSKPVGPPPTIKPASVNSARAAAPGTSTTRSTRITRRTTRPQTIEPQPTKARPAKPTARTGATTIKPAETKKPAPIKPGTTPAVGTASTIRSTSLRSTTSRSTATGIATTRRAPARTVPSRPTLPSASSAASKQPVGSYRLGQKKPAELDEAALFGPPAGSMGSARLGKRESAAFGGIR